jgi:hypothetical protein
MRITQATSNLLEYLLALRSGKDQEPLIITTIGAGDNHLPPVDDLAAPSCLGGGNHQEKQAKSTAKHNHQVPLDAITQSNALGCSILTK